MATPVRIDLRRLWETMGSTCDGPFNGILSPALLILRVFYPQTGILPRIKSEGMLLRNTRCRLFVVLLDESRKRIDVLLQHFLQRFLGELALVVEGIPDAIQVDFVLPH